MLRVALTGGVGSGKTAAAAILRNLGASVSQSDEIGRRLMQPGESVYLAIVERFGQAVVTPSGELDRAALAKLAFQDGRVEELNAIVHPAVIQAQSAWMDAVGTQQPDAVAVVESALVFETKYAAGSADATRTKAPWRTRFDRIVVVTAPIDLRRARYVERTIRTHPSMDEAAARIDFERRAAAQWTDAEKVAFSDAVLENSGSLNDLQRAVERLYARLRQEAADNSAEAM